MGGKTNRSEIIEIGNISQIFSRIRVVAIRVTKSPLSRGDEIKIVYANGRLPDYEQPVTSIEINHCQVKQANIGEHCAVKLACSSNQMPQCGDLVFIIKPRYVIKPTDDDEYPPKSRIMDVDDLDLAP